MARHVFISYASHDKPCAEAICKDLESRGIRCWLAPRDVPLGADYAKSIMEGISGAHVMIVIVSALSNQSVHVPREVERAVSRKIPVLPFRIEAVPLSASLEYFVSSSQWLDASEGRIESHFRELAVAVQQMIARTVSGTSTARPAGTVPKTEKRLKALSARSDSSEGLRGKLARIFMYAGVVSVLGILGYAGVYFYWVRAKVPSPTEKQNVVLVNAQPTVAPSAASLQLMADGVTLRDDNGKFLDTQLLADPRLQWAAELGSADNSGELAGEPIEAEIDNATGNQVAEGTASKPAKSANGNVSVTGEIKIPKSLARKAGVYTFALYSGDNEIASRTFVISTDLAARDRADAAKAAAEEARAQARASREEKAREAAAERERQQELAQQQAQAQQAAAQQAAAQQQAQQQHELQDQLQEIPGTVGALGTVLRSLPHR